MTRWAQNDLAGRILNSKDAKNWAVLRIPALSETQEERDKTNAALGLPAGLPDPLGRQPGITCVPSRYSTEYYVELRDSGLEWRWSAIYMGAPHPPEGNEIKRSWYKIVDELPATLVGRIRYWDKGNTEGGGCRTAGVLLAMDTQGVVYIVDCVAGQWGYAERNDIVKQTAQLDAMRFVVYPTEDKGEAIDSLPGYNNVHIYIEREGGAGGKESNELSIKDLAGFPVYDDIVSQAGNKPERLSSFISYSKAGNVRLLRGAWNEDWLDEAAAWPHGYKDRMDATGGAYRKLRRGGFGLGIAGG
jgi:predicted phage terminase large subunit-like protein